MSTRAILKSFFETGDKPTQAQFEDLIDSLAHTTEDRSVMGLRAHSATTAYKAGDTCIYANQIYISTIDQVGAWNPANWTATGLGNYIKIEGSYIYFRYNDEQPWDTNDIVRIGVKAASPHALTIERYSEDLADWSVLDSL